MASSSHSASWECRLPDHLLMKILSRIPFPQILKVRLLSRIWAFRFLDKKRALEWSSWLHHMDEYADESRTYFQAEVASVSSKWPKYFPIIWRHGVKEFLAWDSRVIQWKRFPFPRVIRGFPIGNEDQIWTFLGSIMCRMWVFRNTILWVQLANLFTGSSFSVPAPFPVMGQTGAQRPCAIHLMVDDGVSHFKILLLYAYHERLESHIYDRIVGRVAPLRLTLQVYAAETRIWETFTKSRQIWPSSVRYVKSVCLDATLYTVFVATSLSQVVFIKFDVGTKYAETRLIDTPGEISNWCMRDLVVRPTSELDLTAICKFVRNPMLQYSRVTIA